MRVTQVVSGLVLLATGMVAAAPADINAVALANAEAAEVQLVARNDDDRKKWEKEQREREKKEREKWEKENRHRNDEEKRKWEREQREREKKERERREREQREREQREREQHRGGNPCPGCYNKPPPGFYNPGNGNNNYQYPGYGPYEPDPKRDGPYKSPDILPYQYCDNLRRAYRDYNGDIRKIAQALQVADNVAKEYVREAKENGRRYYDKDEQWFNNNRRCRL